MKSVDLNAMSVYDLLKLKSQVGVILARRVESERRDLETRLSRLRSVDIEFNGSDRSDKRRKIAPKFRNPDNPSETWAGRGLVPRWMAAALKNGRKMSDFRIGAAASPQAAKRTTRTTRAKRKAGTNGKR